MDRMESKLDEQHKGAGLSASVDLLQSSLEARSDGTDTKVERLSTRLDTRCDAVEKRLDKIAYAVGIRYVVSAGDDNEDRKRLKMRLKEALKLQHADSDGRVIESEREGFLEYFFGIRAPNSRIGKQGSRHATSSTPLLLPLRAICSECSPNEKMLRHLARSQADPPAVKIHARCALRFGRAVSYGCAELTGAPRYRAQR